MTNEVIKAVCGVLKAEYPSVRVYTEHVEQGFQAPAFFVGAAPETTIRRYRGRRFMAVNRIAISYFPPDGSGINRAVNDILERLFILLEYINVGGHPYRGTNMHIENADGFVVFYVNYDFFFCAEKEEDLMTILKTGVGANGGT